MMHWSKSIFMIILQIFSGYVSLYATHNRAGEIHIEQIGLCSDLKVRATVITYTKASSFAADRDSLEIYWGDGTKQWVYRTNGPVGPSGYPQGEVISGYDIKRNFYIAEHAYPARATYRISMLDPNRIDNILNVNFPNSVTVTFYIETVYTFLNPQFQGCNSTPRLLQPPIDFACVGVPFVHNPNAFDVDGDSLSYHLIQPLQSAFKPVPVYLFPDQIGAGTPNLMTLDPVTGDLRWENPQVAGEYNVAFIVVSYRNSVPLDTTIRDMQIFVTSCNNQPPDIVAETEVCVIAGTTLIVPFTVTDPNSGQLVSVTATGGPFQSTFSNPVLNAPTGFTSPPVNGQLLWTPACEEIRTQPWTVVIRAVDNHAGAPLADLHTVLIKVVGPPPEDLKASPDKNVINLSWESPYSCEDAANDYFRGFSVWRRIGSNPFPIDTCDPGLADKGYTRIAFQQRTLQGGRYTFADTQVEPGITYCYRIVADFAQLSAGGNPFNQVASLPSEEICIQLDRNVPLLTMVSVESTSTISGQMEIMWTKPRIPDLDTLLYPGPYTYRLLRSEGLGTNNWTPVPGGTFTAPSFYLANDTILRFDQPLNTNLGYTYIVELEAAGERIGFSASASSVLLSVASTDMRNDLSWTSIVPWTNFNYEVERFDPGTSVWIPLGSTSNTTWTDQPLINGESYCYRIRAFGDYGIPDIASPLINLSQEVCGIPLDTIPPCPPDLSVSNICDSLGQVTIPDLLRNTLRWIHPDKICPGKSDVAGYEIFQIRGDLIELIATVNNGDDSIFIHEPGISLSGCYYITAFDSLGNVSQPSTQVCVDNCPEYSLPNTFTPNGDGQNDLFQPFPYRFIAKVDFKVFNNWGNLVFETSDPDLNWDGKTIGGKQLPDGVYHYVCEVFEKRLDGIKPAPVLLKGFIHIITN